MNTLHSRDFSRAGTKYSIPMASCSVQRIAKLISYLHTLKPYNHAFILSYTAYYKGTPTETNAELWVKRGTLYKPSPSYDGDSRDV